MDKKFVVIEIVPANCIECCYYFDDYNSAQSFISEMYDYYGALGHRVSFELKLMYDPILRLREIRPKQR